MNFCWFSHIVYPQQGGTRFTNNKNTKTYCKTQGALLNVMWQPGWEGSLGENGYIYGWLSPFAVHLKLPQHC